MYMSPPLFLVRYYNFPRSARHNPANTTPVIIRHLSIRPSHVCCYIIFVCKSQQVDPKTTGSNNHFFLGFPTITEMLHSSPSFNCHNQIYVTTCLCRDRRLGTDVRGINGEQYFSTAPVFGLFWRTLSYKGCVEQPVCVLVAKTIVYPVSDPPSPFKEYFHTVFSFGIVEL